MAQTVEGGVLALRTLVSEREPLLQLADFVAGAFHRKYNLQDSRFSELVSAKVVSETVYSWPDLKTRWYSQ